MRDLHTVSPIPVVLVLLAAFLGVISMYIFLQSLVQKQYSTIVVILITYCLPVVLAGIVAYFLYDDRITTAGFLSALAVFVALYVFARHGTEKRIGV